MLACCVEMPIWKHKMRFHVQHNTQIHTQAKTAKISKNTQFFRPILRLFGHFHDVFTVEKLFWAFSKQWASEELCHFTPDGPILVFRSEKFRILGRKPECDMVPYTYSTGILLCTVRYCIFRFQNLNSTLYCNGIQLKICYVIIPVFSCQKF